MNAFKSLILFVAFFLITSEAFAFDSPTLSSPSDATTTTGSTLSWNPVDGASQYHILVDDEQTITSPYIKNYYSTNHQYSPQLSDGTYYWKVAAKDSSGSWSTWSPVWSFILDSTQTTPLSSPTPQPESSEPPTNSFTITNAPTSITSDQNFKVTVSLSNPNNPNNTFYLKGAFKKADGSNYFGLTNVADNWVKNGSSYSDQFPAITDSSGNWSGDLEFKVDSYDSGFEGTGDYIFKVGRYTDSGSGPTWSNEISIHVTALVKASPSLAPSTYPSIKPGVSKTSSQSDNLHTSSVAGIASIARTASSSPLVASVKTETNSSFSPLIIVGAVFILGGLGFIVYFYIRPRLR